MGYTLYNHERLESDLREALPMPAGVADVRGATVYVGTALRIAMRSNYEKLIAAIAESIGHDGPGMLAVCPVIEDKNLGPRFFMIRDANRQPMRSPVTPGSSGRLLAGAV
jgi:hypothetical protein